MQYGSTDKRAKSLFNARLLIYAMTVRNDNSIDWLTSLARIPAR